MTLIDVTGQRFGRLLVRYFSQGKWNCICDCGTFIRSDSYSLRAGLRRSCGCLHREVCGNLHRSHGHAAGFAQSPTYRSWHAMMQRCFNPNSKHYTRYGGRGITVSESWKNFVNFLADLGERPDGKELSRLNESKGYEKGNVVWETHRENIAKRDSSNCGPKRKAARS